MSNYTDLLTITNYADQGFVVRGLTYPYKNRLSKLGGIWRTNLIGGRGWLFPDTVRDKVESFVNVTNTRYRLSMAELNREVEEVEETERLPSIQEINPEQNDIEFKKLKKDMEKKQEESEEEDEEGEEEDEEENKEQSEDEEESGEENKDEDESEEDEEQSEEESEEEQSEDEEDEEQSEDEEEEEETGKKSQDEDESDEEEDEEEDEDRKYPCSRRILVPEWLLLAFSIVPSVWAYLFINKYNSI